MWNLEQAGDEETGSLSSGADSFLDEGSDNAMRPITAKKKSFKHRLTSTVVTCLFPLSFSSPRSRQYFLNYRTKKTVGVKRANMSKSVDFTLLEVFGNESSFSLICRNVKG